VSFYARLDDYTYCELDGAFEYGWVQIATDIVRHDGAVHEHDKLDNSFPYRFGTYAQDSPNAECDCLTTTPQLNMFSYTFDTWFMARPAGGTEENWFPLAKLGGWSVSIDYEFGGWESSHIIQAETHVGQFEEAIGIEKFFSWHNSVLMSG
jgi:hypothetical protein